jgi:transcriptional adapter 3
MSSVTPALDVEDSRPSSLYHGSSSKSRNSSHALNALPSSSRSSVDPRRSYVAAIIHKHTKISYQIPELLMKSERKRRNGKEKAEVVTLSRVQPPLSLFFKN